MSVVLEPGSVSHLPCQRRAKRMLALGEVRLVALGVHERRRVAGFELLVFLLHVEVRAVCAQEDVTRQRLQHTKRLLEVLRDRRVLRVADELVPSVDVRTADDDDVLHLRALCDSHRPRRAVSYAPGGSSCTAVRAY